jgi:glutamate formiminotransferase
VIAALVEAIQSVSVALLDVSSDADHNRTVITFAGDPDQVAEAMFRAARVAVERIDLEQHQGVHPRMGAVDVIPFVPLRDISLRDCAALARAFGRRIGAALNIPVYLYEAGSISPMCGVAATSC